MRSFILLLMLFATTCIKAQTYFTKAGVISFYSKTPLEDIKAEHKQVYAAIDASKKNIAFSLLMKGFQFPKQLMQEHFNENYVESDKFPKANFVGTYTGDVDVNKPGIYPIVVKGALSMHGVSKNIEVPGTIQVESGKLIGKTSFRVVPQDFNIQIPTLVKDKIAKQIDIQVVVNCSNAK